eukprot:SAG11_NODE_2151_length_3742_cov_1.578644_3_plen_98_part_00
MFAAQRQPEQEGSGAVLLQYTCTPAWRWVFAAALKLPPTPRQSLLASQLGTATASATSTPTPRVFAWARIERGGASAWFTSKALDGLRDKDSLAREL